MRGRRRFLAATSGLALAALTARAQSSLPTVGFLRSTPAAPFARIAEAFRDGLRKQGFVEGRNVAVDYRWADNNRVLLQRMAAELVASRVAVIVGNSLAVEAARAATTTIPIVFVTSDDPVERQLVASMSRPGGNLTGVTFHGGGELGAKRLELLHELVPSASTIAILMDPRWPSANAERADVEAAARQLGLRIVVATAQSDGEFESAFLDIRRSRAGALVVAGSPFFSSHSARLTALAAQHRLPAIYDLREHVVSGGLMSYGASFEEAYREAGEYAGRILKGALPAELPVLQPRAYELVISAKAAGALGIAIPQSLRLRAEVL